MGASCRRRCRSHVDSTQAHGIFISMTADSGMPASAASFSEHILVKSWSKSLLAWVAVSPSLPWQNSWRDSLSFLASRKANEAALSSGNGSNADINHGASRPGCHAAIGNKCHTSRFAYELNTVWHLIFQLTSSPRVADNSSNSKRTTVSKSDWDTRFFMVSQ